MKYLTEYVKFIKLFEENLIEIKTEDGVLRYTDEWKTPRSVEREELSNYLLDIFEELKDDRYSIRDGGWTTLPSFRDKRGLDGFPYIWISSRRRSGGMDWDIVDDYISRAVDYLESKGFFTKIHKMNENSQNAQVYLYFDKYKIIDIFEKSFWDKRNLDSLDRKDIVDELYDISYDLKDDGFDMSVEEYYYQPGDRQFIICRILSNEKEDINESLIDTVMRIIDCMYQKSYNLGSNNWVQDGEGRLRVKRKSSVTYYNIEPKELLEFIDVDFQIIELVFNPII